MALRPAEQKAKTGLSDALGTIGGLIYKEAIEEEKALKAQLLAKQKGEYDLALKKQEHLWGMERDYYKEKIKGPSDKEIASLMETAMTQCAKDDRACEAMKITAFEKLQNYGYINPSSFSKPKEEEKDLLGKAQDLFIEKTGYQKNPKFSDAELRNQKAKTGFSEGHTMEKTPFKPNDPTGILTKKAKEYEDEGMFNLINRYK